MPICGSSEKAMTIAASGLPKYTRKRLISASPNTVVVIEVVALGAKITTRIQRSLPREAAASRFDVATGSSGFCAPFATTVSIVVAAAVALRGGAETRRPRGIGALAVTTLE